MTNGGRRGTSGVPAGAYAICAVGTVVACLINVWTVAHDMPALRASGRLWEPLTWELTSAAMTVALLPAIGIATSRGGTPRGDAFGRFVAEHLFGFVGYTLVHVGGFVALRTLIYRFNAEHYVFGGFSAWLYELPKDAGTYCVLAGILASGRALAGRPVQAPPDVPPERDIEPETVVIRDGERTYRVQPGEIVAVAAAGNYAEFHLSDGRRPLMRATLSALEDQLGASGIARSHRSWLVNVAHVREIVATGGGDYRLVMAGETEAPLSRRYGALLGRLRRPAP